MSNTFDQQLASAVRGTLNQLATAESTTENQESAAKLSLYYAHGQSEITKDNYEKAVEKSKEDRQNNELAVNAGYVATNVVAVAGSAASDAASARTNITTAAAAMQTAADAITGLSSRMAGILAIAQAEDNKTDLSKMASSARSASASAAQLAEIATVEFLNATIDASKETASAVVNHATKAQTDINSLSAATQAQLTNAIAATTNANNKISTNLQAERVASGNYHRSRVESSADQGVLTYVNKVTNQNINLKGDPDDSDGKTLIVKYNTNRSSKHVEAYRVIIVPSDQGSGFDLNTAMSLAKEYYFQIGANDFKGRSFEATLYMEGAQGEPKDLSVLSFKEVTDVNGDPVIQGKSYNAFVLTVFTNEYKNRNRLTDDFLSNASQPYISQATLPAADTESIKLHSPNESEDKDQTALRVDFQVNEAAYEKYKSILEYRVIILSEENVRASYKNVIALQKVIEQERTQAHSTAAEMEAKEATEQIGRLSAQANNLTTHINSVISRVMDVYERNSDVAKMLPAIERLNKWKAKFSSDDETALKKLITNTATSTLDPNVLADLESDLKEILTDLRQRASVQKSMASVKSSLQKKDGLREKATKARELSRKAEAEAQKAMKEASDSDFFFDLQLAETVSDGNYTLANPSEGTKSKKSGSDDAKTAMMAVLDKTATDNYGQPLEYGKSYGVYILAASNSSDPDKMNTYANSLTKVYTCQVNQKSEVRFGIPLTSDAKHANTATFKKL